MQMRRSAASRVLALAIALALLAAGAASAKVTCRHRGQPGAEGGLVGLPGEPVPGETYTVTISTGRPPARRDGPDVVLLERGHRMPPKVVILECSGRHDGFGPGEAEEFAVTPTGGLGEYTADVRFPNAGRWAMSVYGLRPAFRDLGMHRVVAPSATGAGSAGAAEALPWSAAIGAAALLAVAIGAAAGWRRSRGTATAR